MNTCLILGGASSVWTDSAKALDLFRPDLTIAVNDMVGSWPGHLDIAATLHPEKLHIWLNERRRNGFNEPETWAHKASGPNGKVEARVDRTTDDWAGSSGLFAVKVALECGCDRIVLAGVPMSAEGAHFFNAAPWQEANAYHKAWLKHQPEIAPFVRSMSGQTMTWFGAPDASWLARAA